MKATKLASALLLGVLLSGCSAAPAQTSASPQILTDVQAVASGLWNYVSDTVATASSFTHSLVMTFEGALDKLAGH